MPDFQSWCIDLHSRSNAKRRIDRCRQSKDDGLIFDSETKFTPVPLPNTAFAQAACDDTIAFPNHVCRCHDLLCKLGSCNDESNDCDDRGGQSSRVLLPAWLIFGGGAGQPILRDKMEVRRP